MAASCYYLAQSAMSIELENLRPPRPERAIAGGLLLSTLYVGPLVLLALAWRRILIGLNGGRNRLPWQEALLVYTKTNLMKYLPGNLLGFVGRNFLLARIGFSHAVIAAGSALEVALALLACGALAVLLAWNELRLLIPSSGNWIVWGVLGGAAIGGLSLAARLGLRPASPAPPSDASGSMARQSLLPLSLSALGLQALAFLALGASFTLVFPLVLEAPIGSAEFRKTFAAFLVAWLLGFLTPGAPGGLGIKEATLVLLLSPTFGPEAAMASALIHRLVSVLGDLNAWLLSQALKRLCPSRFNPS
jgi:glycosyltransferase 2 family protein